MNKYYDFAEQDPVFQSLLAQIKADLRFLHVEQEELEDEAYEKAMEEYEEYLKDLE
jgi:uncharacterized protein YdiU (UPF0061 family)